MNSLLYLHGQEEMNKNERENHDFWSLLQLGMNI